MVGMPGGNGDRDIDANTILSVNDSSINAPQLQLRTH
jgi:hypothetical protein